ncbi:MAG: NADH-quinone oxidoreductase subunit J [Vicingaceae bacterium]
MESIFFYLLALVILVFSFLTISSKNILRTAVYLLFVLCATAGIYFMMNYNFLAAVQLTVYAGGIVVLIIFSILLTHQINTRLELASLKKRLIAAVISFISAATFFWALSKTTWPDTNGGVADTSLNNIGLQLMNFGPNGYVLPFEVISILLLASMVAAIIIAKKFSHD